MKYEFHNWGLTVHNTPERTFIPEKIETIISFVKDAKTNNKRIRVAAYRYTWGDMYSDNDAYFISMLNIRRVTELPDMTSIAKNYLWPTNELNRIQLIPDDNNSDRAYVQLGAAVTNKRFRCWAIDPKEEASKWIVPLQVIMVE